MSRDIDTLAMEIEERGPGGDRPSKLVHMATAAASVPDGARIALGGQSVYQHPMAFARELVRQGRRNLTVVGVLNGPELDLLVGAGCVSEVETSYVGLEQFGLAPNYRRAVESGAIHVHDYSEVAAFDRFRAAEAGWTFLPVYSLAGSDVMEHGSHVVPFTCPVTGQALHAVPAANVDVVVIHVGIADKYGNVLAPSSRLVPQTFDALMARSSDRVIVTAERVVDNQFVRRHADLTVVAGLRVEAVVEAPRGAHPCHSLGFSTLDEQALAEYVEAARSRETFESYLQRYVHDLPDHGAYIDSFPASHWVALETGTGL